MRGSRALGLLVVAQAWLFSPGAGASPAEDSKPKPPDDVVAIEYDHAKENSEPRAYSRMVADGQAIQITISNTCDKLFGIGVTKVVAAAQPADRTLAGTAAPCEPGTLSETIIHQRQYGAYIVELKLPEGTSSADIKLGDREITLRSVVLTIAIQPREWDYEVSGGFTVSRLRDPRYGLQSREVTEDGRTVAKSFVVEDKSARDDARLGAGAFIHVFNTRHPALAASFGLGINQENTASYFVGGSWRMGKAGALTVGYNWGSVDRLPAGTDLEKPVDPNFLSTLGKRVDGAVFIAWSYGFLGDRSLLEKPFKKVEEQSKTTAKPAGAGSGIGSNGTKPGKITNAPGWKDDKPDSCTLSWEPATGAARYRIELCKDQCDADDEQWKPLQGAERISAPPLEHLVIGDLPAGAKLRVRAQNDVGWGEPSPPLEVATALSCGNP